MSVLSSDVGVGHRLTKRPIYQMFEILIGDRRVKCKLPIVCAKRQGCAFG